MLYRFGSFELDDATFELRREEERVTIDARALDLILYLIKNRDRVVPREELLSALWTDVVVQDHSITQAAYIARQALGDDSTTPHFLSTVRGRGLRFIGVVSEIPDRASISDEDRSDGFHTPFVGRAETLGHLDEMLDSARAGNGKLALVAGAPGIGKTRLAEEFAARIAKVATVRIARCPEVERTPPYWPWVQLLRAGGERGADRASQGALSALGVAAPQLAAIAPDLFVESPPKRLHDGADSSVARLRVLDAFARCWTRLAESEPRPLVLFIDDIHRADDSSWDLLSHLAPELQGSRILIIACHREAEVQGDARRRAIVAKLLREATTERIELEGLSCEAIGDFLGQSGVADASESRIREIFDQTGGNPFFVSRVLDRPEGPLAPTLRDAIIHQLDGLPAEVQRVLGHASVIGREFSGDLLDSMSPSAPHSGALRVAQDAGVVQRAPDQSSRFRFHHVLVRDALYEGLEPADRSRLHARATEAIAPRSRGRPELHAEVARHAIEAVHHLGAERAIELVLRAGRTAADALDFDGAAQHFEQALAVAETTGAIDTSLCEILISLGEAHTRAGKRELGRETLMRAGSLARQIGAGERLARVALAVAPGFFAIEVGVCDPGVVQLLEESLRLLPTTNSTLRARLTARLAMITSWSRETRRRLLLIGSARTMAAELNDDSTNAFVAAACVVAEWAPDEIADRRRAIDRLVVQHEGSEQLELSLMGRVFRITTALEEARIDDLELDLDALAVLVSQHPVASAGWYPDLYRGMLAISRGDLAEAASRATRFLRIGQRTLDANVEHSFAAHVAVLGLLSGDAGLFVDPSMEMARRYPAVPAWRLTSAFIAQHAGRDQEACQVLMEFVERGLENLPRDVFFVITLYLAGHLAAELRRPDVGAIVLPLLEPYERRFCVAGFGSLSLGAAARVLGKLARLLERFDEAERHLATAESIEVRAGFRTWLAHTQFEQARLFHARGNAGDGDRARERLVRATELAQPIGLVPLLAEIGSLSHTFKGSA